MLNVKFDAHGFCYLFFPVPLKASKLPNILMTSRMEGKVNSLLTHPHCARHLRVKKLSAFPFILSMFLQCCDFSGHCQLKNLINFNLVPPSFSLLGYWNYGFSLFSHITPVSPSTLPTEVSLSSQLLQSASGLPNPQSPCVKGPQAETSGRQSLGRAHCEESGSKLFEGWPLPLLLLWGSRWAVCSTTHSLPLSPAPDKQSHKSLWPRDTLSRATSKVSLFSI